MIYAATREEIEARRKAFIRKWRLKHRAGGKRPSGLPQLRHGGAGDMLIVATLLVFLHQQRREHRAPLFGDRGQLRHASIAGLGVGAAAVSIR
jgi:hypothetical protein